MLVRRRGGRVRAGAPRIPLEAIDLLAGELGLGPDSVVVDLGAGTGKLTQDLVPRFARVVAVEPIAEMRERLRRRLETVEVLEGTAEGIPLESGSADAVLVAQAFHWFDAQRAVNEIARVVRPGGGLGLLWNTTPWESREGTWFADLGDLLDSRCPDRVHAQRHTWNRWRGPFEAPGPFGPLKEARRQHVQRQTREDFLAQLASRSYIATLPIEARDDLMRAVGAMLDRGDSPVDDGDVTVALATDVFWARKAS
jgi:SAM-dependent methyltransferase